MKLLLTSAGISNNSIRKALIQLLGKPIEDSNALSLDAFTVDQRNFGFVVYACG